MTGRESPAYPSTPQPDVQCPPIEASSSRGAPVRRQCGLGGALDFAHRKDQLLKGWPCRVGNLHTAPRSWSQLAAMYPRYVERHGISQLTGTDSVEASFPPKRPGSDPLHEHRNRVRAGERVV